MKERLYEFFEHTADIGIRVKGKTLKDLFRNSAMAMFELIAKKKLQSHPPAKLRASKATLRLSSGLTRSQIKKYNIKQEANTLDELFINWLNELLSLSATKELIFFDFLIHKLTSKNLQATAKGSYFKNYELNREIKAATYHDLKLEKSKSGWQTQIIFDV